MSNRILTLGLVALFLQGTNVFGQAHFKRFPETVTNDGAYVLAWGLNDDTQGGVESKTEVPPKGPELGDPDSDSADDYVVDTNTGKVVATIPEFAYFAGSPEGRQNHFGIQVGWSPDNHGGLAIYDGRYSTAAAAWIDPADHVAMDIWAQIQKAIQQHVLKKKHKNDEDDDGDEIAISTPVFVRGNRLVLEAMVGALSSKSNPTATSYELLFHIKGDPKAPTLEFVSAKLLRDDSNEGPGDDQIEAELNKVYQKLSHKLTRAEREKLKQEQLKWLQTRAHVDDGDEQDDKEFIQLEFTRRRVNELRVRAQYQ